MLRKRGTRMLVGKTARNKNKVEITQNELSHAIRGFLDKGGLIKTLPPQEDQSRRPVGMHLDSAYEVVLEY